VNVWCLSSQKQKPDQQLVVGHDEGEDGRDDVNDDEVMMEVMIEVMMEHGDGA
jgi:hypothetical protein